MLYEAMIKEIETTFSSLKFTVNEENKLISIPSIHKEIGSIDIQDDYEELTIFVGDFTHWHCGYFDGKPENSEGIKEIVSEVSEYLRDMFNDKIFMWGNAMKGGGSQLIEEGFKTDKQGYVWSGLYHS